MILFDLIQKDVFFSLKMIMEKEYNKYFKS